MSDQVSGLTGWLFMMICGLVYASTVIMPWAMGEPIAWYDWLVPLPVVIPVILLGLYLVTHDYSWWSTHAEDRVRRIRELVDEPECKNPPGGNA